MLKVEPFYLKRKIDTTGISGIGVVAIGAKYPSGLAVLEWQSFTTSLSIFKSMEHLIEVHSHGGNTEIIMGYPEEPKKKRKKKNESN